MKVTCEYRHYIYLQKFSASTCCKVAKDLGILPLMLLFPSLDLMYYQKNVLSITIIIIIMFRWTESRLTNVKILQLG